MILSINDTSFKQRAAEAKIYIGGSCPRLRACFGELVITAGTVKKSVC